VIHYKELAHKNHSFGSWTTLMAMQIQYSGVSGTKNGMEQLQ